MAEFYFHNGCIVIILPLCLDSEMLSAVAIKEHASSFMNLNVWLEILNVWQCSYITTFGCVIAIYIRWHQATPYYLVEYVCIATAFWLYSCPEGNESWESRPLLQQLWYWKNKLFFIFTFPYRHCSLFNGTYSLRIGCEKGTCESRTQTCPSFWAHIV